MYKKRRINEAYHVDELKLENHKHNTRIKKQETTNHRYEEIIFSLVLKHNSNQYNTILTKYRIYLA